MLAGRQACKRRWSMKTRHSYPHSLRGGRRIMDSEWSVEGNTGRHVCVEVDALNADHRICSSVERQRGGYTDYEPSRFMR